LVESILHAVCPKIKTGSASRFSDTRFDRRVALQAGFGGDRLAVLGCHYRVLPQSLATSFPDVTRWFNGCAEHVTEPSRSVCHSPKRATGFRRHLPWGSVPYDVSIRAVVITTAYQPSPSTHGVSHPLSGLIPPGPRGFVSRHIRPWDSASSAFPTRSAVTPLDVRCSRAVELRRLPTRASTSERCSNRASVRPATVVKQSSEPVRS